MHVTADRDTIARHHDHCDLVDVTHSANVLIFYLPKVLVTYVNWTGLGECRSLGHTADNNAADEFN